MPTGLLDERSLDPSPRWDGVLYGSPGPEWIVRGIHPIIVMQHAEDSGRTDVKRVRKHVPLHELPNRVFFTFLYLVIIAVCVFALTDSTAPAGLGALMGWAAVGLFTSCLVGLWVPAVGNALFRAFRAARR
jgi:hypothetical protein